MSSRPTWTPETVAKVAEALQVLAEAGVWSAHVMDGRKAEITMHRETLPSVVAATGQKATVPGTNGSYWKGQVDAGFCIVEALFPPVDLPLIGYRVTETPALLPDVLPVDQEEDAQHGE